MSPVDVALVALLSAGFGFVLGWALAPKGD